MTPHRPRAPSLPRLLPHSVAPTWWCSICRSRLTAATCWAVFAPCSPLRRCCRCWSSSTTWCVRRVRLGSALLLRALQVAARRAALPHCIHPPSPQVRRTWTRGDNSDFLGKVAKLAQKRRWGQLVKAFRAALDKWGTGQQQQQQQDEAGSGTGTTAGKKSRKSHGGSSKAVRAGSTAMAAEGRRVAKDQAAAEAAATAAEGGFAFAFVEGA